VLLWGIVNNISKTKGATAWFDLVIYKEASTAMLRLFFAQNRGIFRYVNSFQATNIYTQRFILNCIRQVNQAVLGLCAYPLRRQDFRN